MRQFFSGLRVSIGDKEHVISQADCIQNIRFIVKSQIVVIFDEMLKTNPQIEAYFLGKKAQFGADAELYQCNPAEQFDHFVFFIVRRKEWAKKIWETSHIELMEVFSNFAEKEQAKNIKLLFKKYVLCFHEDILEEFIEKIDKAFLLNEILNILNAMEFNDNYYGRQTEKNRHILIQAINGRLLKIEDKQVKSMLVDGGHENLLEGEDEPNAMQAPKASVTEETLCVYSKIKNNKEIQQTWDCDATFRLYFSGCILLKTTVADNTLYKIDLAECIQNFKLASIYSMQAIVVFMCDNNNELKDYLSGKEVILNGELHVNNDAEHLDWFLKLLKSRAYDVVSDVWTKEYAERIVATLSALTPAKQNEMLNDILATKLISSVKCFKKIIKMINDINFLDKMLDVLQSKKRKVIRKKLMHTMIEQ